MNIKKYEERKERRRNGLEIGRQRSGKLYLLFGNIEGMDARVLIIIKQYLYHTNRGAWVGSTRDWYRGASAQKNMCFVSMEKMDIFCTFVRFNYAGAYYQEKVNIKRALKWYMLSKCNSRTQYKCSKL